jgi:hypothetical protein
VKERWKSGTSGTSGTRQGSLLIRRGSVDLRSRISEERRSTAHGYFILCTATGDCRWWHVISVSIAGVFLLRTNDYEYSTRTRSGLRSAQEGCESWRHGSRCVRTSGERRATASDSHESWVDQVSMAVRGLRDSLFVQYGRHLVGRADTVSHSETQRRCLWS